MWNSVGKHIRFRDCITFLQPNTFIAANDPFVDFYAVPAALIIYYY